MINLVAIEKNLLVIKTLKKLEIERNFLNPMKVINENSIAH
jgi:hypothetical protein